MSLLGAVVERLRTGGVRFVLIGAGAMAAHGVTRGTRDLDLLVVDRQCLERRFWDALGVPDVSLSIRSGDAADPLGGVVRLSLGDEAIDVIVGKTAWQARVFDGAVILEIDRIAVPVAGRLDLILLKLYAGGPQDAWDIAQLLSAAVGDATIDDLERRLDTLPPECRRLWARIRAGGA